MTDQDINEEMHRLLEEKQHFKIDRFECNCGLRTDKTFGINGDAMLSSHVSGVQLNFLTPGDKELGVMMRWALSKKLVVGFYNSDCGDSKIGCCVDSVGYQHAPTEAVALREAIRAYGREGS